MTFLTPLGALVAVAALFPVAAVIAARARTEVVRRRLGLPAPDRATELRPLLGAAAIALLGLAAAQPASTSTVRPATRTDVQAVFVLDISRSMAAAESPSSPSRLDRAVSAAVRLRNTIAAVPSGVLTMTDRVLPDLFPVADVSGFDAVVERAVQIESPPPRSTAPRATSYSALAQIASGNVFPPSASKRIVVLLSDGESEPVQTSDLARALSGYRFMSVRFWNAHESIYVAGGKVETAYRPDPASAATASDLATALGGRSFDEADLRAAAAYLRSLAGSGPSAPGAATEQRRLPLAPYVALLALLAALAHFAAGRIRLTRQ